MIGRSQIFVIGNPCYRCSRVALRRGPCCLAPIQEVIRVGITVHHCADPNKLFDKVRMLEREFDRYLSTMRTTNKHRVADPQIPQQRK